MVEISTDKILDRDLSLAASRDNRRRAAPVLREIVDEGVRVFERCGHSVKEKDVHVGTLFPFLHLLEMLDGAEVCLDHSAVVPAQVILRAAFEALLALEWVAQEDSIRRGAAYVVVDVHDRIADYDQYDPSTDRGRAFAADIAKDGAAFPLSLPDHIDLDQRRDSIRTVLEQPHLSEANQEYLRVRQARKRRPKFYELFGGPGDLEQLARRVGRSGQYAVLNRGWSRTSHAADLRRQLREGAPPGTAAVCVIRDPDQMLTTYGLAMSLGLSGIRKMLGHHRAGEIERGTFRDWYVREIQDVYRGVTRAGKHEDVAGGEDGGFT